MKLTKIFLNRNLLCYERLKMKRFSVIKICILL